MEAIIDWLSFTVKMGADFITPFWVIDELLKLNPFMFEQTHGGYGYKTQRFFNNIRVYSDGREGMGVHVQISGEGIRYLENTKDFKWEEFLCTLLSYYDIQIIRLDVAVDDKDEIIDLNEIKRKAENGEVVSKWRHMKPVTNVNLTTGENEGLTLYFGNRQSDILCRFYDKRAKEKKKYESLGKELPDHWVRCELEMHRERARSFAKEYVKNYDTKPLGQLLLEVLSHYMRITDKTHDTNRSRWENCVMWNRFIQSVEKLRLAISKPKGSIENIYVWTKRSVAPSLYLLFAAEKGNMNVIADLIKDGSKKQSKRHNMILGEYLEKKKGEKVMTVDEHRETIMKKIQNSANAAKVNLQNSLRKNPSNALQMSLT